MHSKKSFKCVAILCLALTVFKLSYCQITSTLPPTQSETEVPKTTTDENLSSNVRIVRQDDSTTTTTTTTTVNPRFGWPATSDSVGEQMKPSSTTPRSTTSTTTRAPMFDFGDLSVETATDPKPRDYAVDPPKDEAEFAQYTRYLADTFGENIDSVVTEQLPLLLRFAREIKLSPDCSSQFLNVYLAARQFQPWAIRLLDATGKVPDGILHGAVTSFGSYDECLDIVVEDGGEDTEKVTGKYCSLKIKPFLPPDDGKYKRTKLKAETVDDVVQYFRFIQFHLGVCLPSACTLQDMQGFADFATGITKMNVTATKCEVKEPLTFNNEEMIAGCVMAVILLLILFGTTCDIVRRNIIHRRAYDTPQKPGPMTKLFQAFSVYSNGKFVLNTKTKENNVLPLHGLRVLSILWIILGHTYLSFGPPTAAGMVGVIDATQDTLFQLVTNADLATDTFFFVSGFLVCYIALKKLEDSKGKFNIIKFYIHRYLRMTPPLMMLLAFVLFAHRLGSGPLWHELVDERVETCKRMWWTNLVYITNFLKREDVCFTHLWYISADMQFYVFSPVIFILLFRKPKIGKFLIALGVCICVAISAILTYLNDYPPVLLFNDMSPWLRRQYYYNIFRMPYYHAGVYLIGMAAGYIYTKHKKININPIFELLGWCASTAACLLVIFSTTKWNRNELPTTAVAATYSALARTAWGLSIGWIVLMCSTGNGGFIRTILSWKLFVPLSRISYLAFLIHPGLVSVYTGQTRVLLYYSHFNAIYLFLSHSFAAYLCAFALSFAVEMPFRRLERVFCRGDDDNLNMLSCVCDDNQSGSFTKEDGTTSTGWTDKFAPIDGQAQNNGKTSEKNIELPKIVVHECHL